MKQILMCAIASLLIFPAMAQLVDAASVPSEVKNSFAKQYPGNQGKWELENGKYEVSFKQGDNNMSMLIEPNGSIAQTEMEIKVADLPSAAKAYVKQYYRKYIDQASKITMADGTINYEAEVAGVDVLFDTNGKFLKEMKESDNIQKTD